MTHHPQSIAEFRECARRRLPRFVFDFIDGGSGGENTLAENRAALDRVRLLGRAPVDVSQCSQSVNLFGRDHAMPVIIGPTGLAGAAWPQGDLDLARAAADTGIPFVMSTAATVSMEDLARAGAGDKWFQLYLFRDRAVSRRLLARARTLGFSALEVTVDNAIPGRRLRDVRNGFSLPFRWSPGKLASLLAHPAWTLRMARSGPPTLEVMAAELGLRQTDTIAELMQSQLDPSVGWEDLKWVRETWTGPLIVKGLLDPGQVPKALEIGVDGIVVSNHGGRQLDGAVATIDILPEFRSAAGSQLTLLVDSGFRTGSDIARALALGADAVQIGRATLYALASGGEEGVRQALGVLKSELAVAQMLMGARSVKDFDLSMLRRHRPPERPELMFQPLFPEPVAVVPAKPQSLLS
ncbi:alpha-hydroxy-acid oxidizing protein [Stappia taiwanensis]|uniref:Alpha-hydroxy-acid oxidizing protein n=1 Tax=Stappia taiwanensis TaxID=992267 RepID=A0A838XV06_9HYPH|nr:alpha-hydroxy acid oxidase [Stappia taiwanensis]MBA4612448.1 alpha-hydroxy-acid oxidizing protein [Stappia taiwanensis]GGF05460.1 FMN-dependent dehydrogenase [Stappia taiwanensis]